MQRNNLDNLPEDLATEFFGEKAVKKKQEAQRRIFEHLKKLEDEERLIGLDEDEWDMIKKHRKKEPSDDA